MRIKCGDIKQWIEQKAPARLAEEWDNVGLQIGSLQQEVGKVLVCLDVTGAVVEEAIRSKVDLILSHHPVLFKGMKKITEEDPKGKMVCTLIRHGISVYSAHTNLDVAEGGVNDQLAAVLGLQEMSGLNDYQSEKLFKLVVFVPAEHTEAVRDAITAAGAGWIGSYRDCTFAVRGRGTFTPLEGTNPFIGTLNEQETVEEDRLETIVPQPLVKQVVAAMLAAHPYEEAAYDLYPLELKEKAYPLGKVGKLKKPMEFNEFIQWVKASLKTDQVRVVGKREGQICKVAVFCGSFDGNLSGLLQSGADVLVTGDLKYHTAMDMLEMGLCVVDAGHFNTERVMVPALAAMVKEAFPQIEVFESQMERDPFNFT